MEVSSGEGAQGSQRCAPLGVWQGPCPGQVSGQLPGPEPARTPAWGRAGGRQTGAPGEPPPSHPVGGAEVAPLLMPGAASPGTPGRAGPGPGPGPAPAPTVHPPASIWAALIP